MESTTSKLDRLIATTRAVERGLRADLAQARADIPVRQRIEQDIAKVGKRLASMTNLRALPKAQAAAMAVTAREYRATAQTLSDARARLFESKAARLEKRHALWCDHHGKPPVPARAARITKPPTDKVTRGGRRTGAGRPDSGNVQMLIRLKAASAERLRELAGKAGISPGQWVEKRVAGGR